MRVACLIVVAGCGLSTDRDPGPPPPSSPPKIEKIGDEQVDVFVDNLKVTTLSVEQLRAGVRLDELLANHPYLGWASVTSYGDSVGPIEWIEPVTNYAGLVPYAFFDAGATLALVDPSHTDQRETRADGIDEIRVTLAPKPRTPIQALAARCVPESKGEAPPPPGPKKWKGASYQFNIPMHWRNEMSLDLADLADLPTGARIGTVKSWAVEWEQLCTATLYRVADRHGRRAMIARVTKGSLCVDSYVEVACKGSELEVWAYYADTGLYVENGTYKPAP